MITTTSTSTRRLDDNDNQTSVALASGLHAQASRAMRAEHGESQRPRHLAVAEGKGMHLRGIPPTESRQIQRR
jgi:hypothetical protein